MSIEIKCDRCGGPTEAIREDSYYDRSAKDSILFTRDGKAKVVDLCEKCRDDLDIFMSGKMPAPEYKPGELAYFELPDPNVFVSEDRSSNRLDLQVSIDLDRIDRLFEPYDPSPIIKQVILGMKLR